MEQGIIIIHGMVPITIRGRLPGDMACTIIHGQAGDFQLEWDMAGLAGDFTPTGMVGGARPGIVMGIVTGIAMGIVMVTKGAPEQAIGQATDPDKGALPAMYIVTGIPVSDKPEIRQERRPPEI